MKRIVCWFIAVFMIFCLMSCNKEQQGNNSVVSENKKSATFNDIVSVLRSVGYEGGEYSESELTEMKSAYSNVKSVKSGEFGRGKYLSKYDDTIYDVCGLTYYEFSDEQSAIDGYGEIFIEVFDDRPTEKRGKGYTKSILHERDYGQTIILSRVNNIVVMLWNDYDDYMDANLQYDNKPELILTEFGY